MKKTFWYYIRKIPAVKKKIEEETVKTKNTLAQEMHDSIQGMPYLTKLPERGLTEEELDRELAKYKKLCKLETSIIYNFIIFPQINGVLNKYLVLSSVR